MKENIFQHRIKDLMREYRYSQKKICKVIGITEASFSTYMTSDRLPRVNVLVDIAKLLHTNVDFLIGNDDNYGYDQIKIILENSKDDLSKNQKLALINILMDKYDNPRE